MFAPLAVLALNAALAAATPAAATPAAPRADDACTTEAFTIEGRAVTLQFCAPAAVPPAEKGKRAVVVLRETVSAGGVTFVRAATLDYHQGAESSRAIDDVPLDKLNIAKTLHLSVEFKPGSVHLEHVLLIPGAIPLK